MKILGCTNLGLGGVVLLDDGPVFPIQTVSDPELLHKDVPFAVLPSLNHHTAHHLVLAEIHLPGTTRKKKKLKPIPGGITRLLSTHFWYQLLLFLYKKRFFGTADCYGDIVATSFPL